MNALTKAEPPKQSLIQAMAAKAQMEPTQFANTVRATVMPSKHTNEQFAALMLVAHEYGLNPIVKEIYAFPAKGGGIVPIVSIDGWVNLVNSHPKANGFNFEMEHNEKGELISCTCKMFRKDRDHPVEITEYLVECKRNTDPWKMQHRMLRHKALIQAARYAFGFSGIYDEDEGAKIADIEPSKNNQKSLTPPPPPVDEEPSPIPNSSDRAANGEVEEAEIVEEKSLEQMSPEEVFAQAIIHFGHSLTQGDLEMIWELNYQDLDLGSDDSQHLESLFKDREAELTAKLLGA